MQVQSLRCVSLAHTNEASHFQREGSARIKPAQLQALYTLIGPPPRNTVTLIDDVLTTETHFVAAKQAIQAALPLVQVAGIFLARRAISESVNTDLSV